MVSRHLVEQDMFSFWLNRTAGPKPESGGELVLGGFDSAHFASPISWVALSRDAYWQFKMDKCVYICVFVYVHACKFTSNIPYALVLCVA